MRVHRVTYGSRVNGPGVRTVLHTQGCTIGCAGCFNAHTWDADKGDELTVDTVIELLLSDIKDGVTISGGEPTEQWEELHVVLQRLRDVGHSVVLFTGLTKAQLEEREIWKDLQRLTDILIVGPYDRTKHIQSEPLRSSSNQEVFFFSEYTSDDLESVPEIEVHVDGDTVTIAGFPSKPIRTTLLRELREGACRTL